MPIPSVTADDVVRAMAEFDQHLRAFGPDTGTKYAVEAGGRRYPPKQLLALAAGVKPSDFSGGPPTNRIFEKLGFKVIAVDPHSATMLTPEESRLQQQLLARPIPSLDELVQALFDSRWMRLDEARKGQFRALDHADFPGVYMIAWTSMDLTGRRVRCDEKDVYYVGVSYAGVAKRLAQFCLGLQNGKVHSGAKRHFMRHGACDRQGGPSCHFYVVSVAVPATVKKAKRSDEDLRRLGITAALEWYAIAHVKKMADREPCLNAGVGASRAAPA